MNVECLAVFTSNGLAFAAVLYVLMTCDIPEAKGSRTSRLWTRACRMMTQCLEAVSLCVTANIRHRHAERISLEDQEQQMSSMGSRVNKA